MTVMPRRRAMPALPRRLARSAWLLALACAFGPAAAVPLGAPADVSLTQRLGAELPVAADFVEADGRPVRLGELFGQGRPVLLVLGYYRCPQLCGVLMHGVLEAVQALGPRVGAPRIVAVSIDPEDTPATARARLDVDLAYAAFLRSGGHTSDPPPDLHLLTGTAASIARVAEAVGYAYERSPGAGSDTAPARYAHPAALVVATPQGRISRYLMGVRFEPTELRAALADAGQGRTAALTDRIALLCAHLDLRLGRHSLAVMNAARGIGLLVLAALAA
ncbi:MAG: SCO family protein, partial [Rhizobacter sp.]